MAAKRSAPKKPAPKARSAVSKDVPVIKRSTIVVPSPVDIRVENEPAVVVAPSVAETAQLAGTHDWAPAPKQLGWIERVKATLMPGREAKKDKTYMAEHMAAVKAGVLQELETMGVKKGVAVKGSPFSTVMLPVARKKRPIKWWLVGALVALIVVVMVWVGRKPEQPEAVLGQAVAAIRNHDVKTFEEKVDVASVATSVVNQMFNVPQQDGALAAKMTAFVKPGLADGLKDEILAAVGGEKLDDSGNTLLGKLWGVLGGKYVRLGTANVAMQDERMAVAEVPMVRTDLSLTLPLQVVMTQTADGAWQVVDVPNLGAVLASVAEAEQVLEERRLQVAAAAEPANVRVEDVKKAKDGNGAGSDHLMLSMALVNTGASAAKDVQLDVSFGDAAGQPMMTTRLTLDGELAAGGRREQVWSVPIDRERAAERYVADLPLSALTVTVNVVK